LQRDFVLLACQEEFPIFSISPSPSEDV
jgi:hypothetical protein